MDDSFNPSMMVDFRTKMQSPVADCERILPEVRKGEI